MFCLVDGEPQDHLPVTDSTVLRGDGCFEAIRSYDGFLLGLDLHLDRLERSATRLGMELPARRLIVEWANTVAPMGDGIVRIVATRGDAVPGSAGAGRCLVMHHPLGPLPEVVRLAPVVAPWHSAGVDWALAGVKSVSYAPNLSAGRQARHAGFDDALLVSTAGVVLEGPTFTVAWVVDGRLETPGMDLFILDSITRRIVLDLARHRGIEVVEGVFPLQRLDQADEVMALSTVKEVTPVTAVGERILAKGAVTAALAEAFAERVAQLMASQGGVPR